MRGLGTEVYLGTVSTGEVKLVFKAPDNYTLLLCNNVSPKGEALAIMVSHSKDGYVLWPVISQDGLINQLI